MLVGVVKDNKKICGNVLGLHSVWINKKWSVHLAKKINLDLVGRLGVPVVKIGNSQPTILLEDFKVWEIFFDALQHIENMKSCLVELTEDEQALMDSAWDTLDTLSIPLGCRRAIDSIVKGRVLAS